MRPLHRIRRPCGALVAVCLLLVALAELGLISPWALGQESKGPTQTLLNEYRVALKRLQSAHERVHFSGTVHEVMENKGKPPIRDHYYKIGYSANGRYEKLNEVFRFNGFLDRVYVRGERTFALRRTTEGGIYVLDQLGDLPGSFVTEFQENKNMLVNAAMSISNESIPHLIESPRFKITQCARSGPGLTMVRFHCDYGTERPRDQYDMIGWFEVDPARAWSVVEYEVHRKIPGLPKSEQLDMLITGKVRYPTKAGPCETYPQQVNVSYLSLIPGGRQFERRYEFQAETCSAEPIPAQEFTLAAYGMGDLDRPPASPQNRLAYWAVGLAAIVIGASYVLRRMSR
jgi:hypothetical protein